MSFEQRYQLGSQIPEWVGQADYSVAARQIPSGRPVTIHLLAGGRNCVNETLLREIAALPPEFRVCFLETGESRGTIYVITDAIAGNPPLRQWMAALASKISAAKMTDPSDL